MKFLTTPRFDRDFISLPREHRALFTSVVKQFHTGCLTFEESGQMDGWPKSLRVRRLTSAPRIWEMTWSFASPDGRATFEFVERDREVMVLWRRIGSHAIYRNP